MQEGHDCSSMADLKAIWTPQVVDVATTSSVELLSQAQDEVGKLIEDISPEKVAEYKAIFVFESPTKVFSAGSKILWMHKI